MKKIYVLHQGRYKLLVLMKTTEQAYLYYFKKNGECFSIWVPKNTWGNKKWFYVSGELKIFEIPEFIKVKKEVL